MYLEAPSATPVESMTSTTILTSRRNEKTRPEFHYSAAAPRLVAGHSVKDLKISAPRFVLPGELTQPSITLASFSEKKGPVRPDSTTQKAAQQAVQHANTAATMRTSSHTQAATPPPPPPRN